MTLPGFTAMASCYRSPRSYRAGHVSPAGDAVVRPATFICDTYSSGTVCTCDGLDNCIDMFSGTVCSAVAQCDASQGAGHPVCGCVAN